MELKLKRGIRVWRFRSHSKSYSMICGTVAHQAAVRMHRSPIKTHGLALQPQDRNIHYYSVVFTVQISSASYILGCTLLQSASTGAKWV